MNVWERVSKISFCARVDSSGFLDGRATRLARFESLFGKWG
jgi:hypothetical protein